MADYSPPRYPSQAHRPSRYSSEAPPTNTPGPWAPPKIPYQSPSQQTTPPDGAYYNQPARPPGSGGHGQYDESGRGYSNAPTSRYDTTTGQPDEYRGGGASCYDDSDSVSLPSHNKIYSGPVLPTGRGGAVGGAGLSRYKSTSESEYHGGKKSPYDPQYYGSGYTHSQTGHTHHPQTQFYGYTLPPKNQFSGQQSQTQYGGHNIPPQAQRGGQNNSQYRESNPQTQYREQNIPPPTQFGQNSPPFSSQTQYGGQNNPQSHYGGPDSPQTQYRNHSGPIEGGRGQPPVEFKYNQYSKPVQPQPTPPATPPGDTASSLREEVEIQKVMKEKLIKEIGHLDGQRKMIEEEIRVLTAEKEQLDIDVEHLKVEENKFRTRLMQAEQNLDLVSQVAEKRRSEQELKNESRTSDTAEELKRQEERIKQLEISLRERESDIKRKEMELQTQSDILYQRNKEISLKEYDLRNSGSEQQTQNRFEKERDLHCKQLELDERENNINNKEQSLLSREQHYYNLKEELDRDRERLESWRLSLESEDERVQQNMKSASKLFDEAKQMKEDALSAAVTSTPIKDPAPTSSSNPSDKVTPTPPTDPPPKTQPHLVKAHTIGHSSGGGASGGGTESHKDAKGRRATYSFTDQGVNDDESIARYMQLQLNNETYNEDLKFAESLQEINEPPEIDEKTTLRINLGLSKDATDEEVQARLQEFTK
ncbi:PREDICTED: PERQ amino acid-rich with GYF domain-containing protein 2-like isoform X2 [Amphimedon queenslandica]|uniref:Uncharacterized protein n=1 Tax=Amphimedon queenslandica TaxID=400682 RepID=A0A1X7TVS1_AMPQE|nr:PREDICTED: PERQ amino acid-rich with GYF domain-containing protein 2-like isoform X2 [Amphimedon queenslandica]|eukprot:XP_019857554.1 PREDICTED: PERQ amino acid-rich with GYF domain-containing protein 2-like isoform X2 [Amphimedon queenslandica]